MIAIQDRLSRAARQVVTVNRSSYDPGASLVSVAKHLKIKRNYGRRWVICRAVRNGQNNHDVPILILTARREESDKVVGLESGADDYLTKPFGVRELVARARALLRRPRQPALAAAEDLEPAEGQPIVRVHDVEIDPARRRVRVDGKDVELTDQEFRLLHLLATRAGIVFSREALLAKIWRGDTFVTVRSVDTLVKRLRRRIERDSSQPRYLLTVWGVGYKFADV